MKRIPIWGMVICLGVGLVTGQIEWFVGVGLWAVCFFLVRAFGVPK